jgi:hypothetical protein
MRYFKVVWDHTKIYFVCNAGDYIECPKLTASWYAKVMRNQHIASLPTRMPTAVLPCRIETGRSAAKLADQTYYNLQLMNFAKQSYIDSTEAEVLFNPTEDETALDAIDRRMLLVILAFFKRFAETGRGSWSYDCALYN